MCPSGWNCPATTTGLGVATATIAQWGQCGGKICSYIIIPQLQKQFVLFEGIGYPGYTQCGIGFTCYVQNAWWSQCLQTGTCPSSWTCTSVNTIGSCGQCGGK